MNKVIHYCWFGGNPLPEMAKKCIASWKKYCPDYEIKEWNESNFDINISAYTKEAYTCKKWAFVSDYARFYILYNYGGLYFDTDVELIEPIDDIVAAGAFMGFEKQPKNSMINAGLGLGADAKHPLYKEILEDYEKCHFVVDGQIDYTSVVDRVTALLQKHGLQCNDTLQVIEGITMYPSDFFCPLDCNTNMLVQTENTRSVHWYDASWLDDRMRNRQKVCANIRSRLPGAAGKMVCFVYLKSSYLWEWIQTGQLFQKIGRKLGIKKTEKGLK